jgi:hypothetical protein
MSELKVDKVSPRTGNYVALNTVGSKNIIINGDMSIAQRGTSVSGITSGGYHTVDRFQFIPNNMGTFTMSQDTDVPTGQGFAYSTKLDCTTADAAPAAGDYIAFYSRFEGQNLQYLKKGTSNAESLTLSFWVKSAKTGTYIVELVDDDNSRGISKSYTIDTANTWEKKTITYAGDTTGTLDNDNNSSFRTWFWLGAGSTYSSGTLNTSWNTNTAANRAVGQVNLADNTANNFWITGIQLEAGTTASDFEFLPYDVNLRRCYRYYWGWWDKADAESNGPIGGTGFMYIATNLYLIGFYPVEMRATPSLDQGSGTQFYRFLRDGATDYLDDFTLNAANNRTNKRGYEIINSTDVSGTAGQAGWIRCNNTDAFVNFDAEL